MVCLDDEEQTVVGLHIMGKHEEGKKLRKTFSKERKKALASYISSMIDKAKAHVEET